MAKLIDVLAYIFKKYPRKHELSNDRLTKLVYLADWHQAINHKRQITNVSWYFDNYGPFVKDIHESLENNPDLFEIEKTTDIYGDKKPTFKLKDRKYQPAINEQEQKSIDHVIEVTKELNVAQFIRLIYSTYPILSSDRYSQLNLINKAEEYQVEMAVH